MDRDLRKIISTSIVLLVFGGVGALVKVWGAAWQIFIAFFPFFVEAAKQSLEDYLTSPYFITGIVMTIASGFGIWFGKRGGKTLYLVISLITMLISLTSIGANLWG